MLQNSQHLINKKDRQLHVYEQSITKLQSELDKSVLENKTLREQISEKNKIIDGLQTKISNFDSQAGYFGLNSSLIENETKIYQDFVLFSSSQTSYLINTIKNLEREVNVYLTETRNAQRENQILNQEKQILSEREKNIQGKDKKYQEAFQALITEFSKISESYNNSVKKLSADLENYKIKNSNLIEQEKRISEEFESFKSQATKTVDQNNLQITSLFDTLNYKDKEKINLDQEISNLKNLVNVKDKQIDELKIKTLKFQQESQNSFFELRNENKDLKAKVFESDQKIQLLTNELEQVKSLESDIDKLRSKIDEENSEINSIQNLKKLYLEERAKRENLENKLGTAKNQLSQSIPSLLNKYAEVERMNADYSSIKNKFAKCEEELLKVYKENKQLEAELSHLKESQKSQAFSSQQLAHILIKYQKIQQILIRNLGDKIVSEEDEVITTDENLYESIQDLHNKYEKLLNEYKTLKNTIKNYENSTKSNVQPRVASNVSQNQPSSSLNVKKVAVSNEVDDSKHFEEVLKLKKENLMLKNEIKRLETSEAGLKAKSLQSNVNNSNKLYREDEYLTLAKERDHYKMLFEQENSIIPENSIKKDEFAQLKTQNAIFKNQINAYENKIDSLKDKIKTIEASRDEVMSFIKSSSLSFETTLNLKAKVDNLSVIVRQYEERFRHWKKEVEEYKKSTSNAVDNLRKIFTQSDPKNNYFSYTDELTSLKVEVENLKALKEIYEVEFNKEKLNSKLFTENLDILVEKIFEKVEVLKGAYSNQELHVKNELEGFFESYQNKVKTLNQTIDQIIQSRDKLNQANNEEEAKQAQENIIEEENIAMKYEDLKLILQNEIELSSSLRREKDMISIELEKLKEEFSLLAREKRELEAESKEKYQRLQTEAAVEIEQKKNKIIELESKNQNIQAQLDSLIISSNLLLSSQHNNNEMQVIEYKNQLVEYLQNKSKILMEEITNLKIENNINKDALNRLKKEKEEKISYLEKELELARKNQPKPEIPKSNELKVILENNQNMTKILEENEQKLNEKDQKLNEKDQKLNEKDLLLKEHEQKLKENEQKLKLNEQNLSEKENKLKIFEEMANEAELGLEENSNKVSDEDNSKVDELLRLSEIVKVVVQGLNNPDKKE